MCLFYILWRLRLARLGGDNFKIQIPPEGLVKSLYIGLLPLIHFQVRIIKWNWEIYIFNWYCNL